MSLVAARLNSSDTGETACNSHSTTKDSSTAPDKPLRSLVYNYGISVAGPNRPFKYERGAPPFKSFDGVIDDFAAWYRALSDEEIAKLYAGAAKGLDASEIDRGW